MEKWASGVKVITVPDQRWARCDIKSVSLLPNVLANQLAQEAGAHEAVLVRDGFALEGSLSNFAMNGPALEIQPVWTASVTSSSSRPVKSGAQIGMKGASAMAPRFLARRVPRAAISGARGAAPPVRTWAARGGGRP